jgi:hypothetical protein
VTHVISRQYEMTCYTIIARKDSQTACTERSDYTTVTFLRL